DDARDAESEALQVGMRTRRREHGVVSNGRWRDMVVEAAVLVERQHERHAVPLRALGKGAVHLRDEDLALPDVVERVVVVARSQVLVDRREVGVEEGYAREGSRGCG